MTPAEIWAMRMVASRHKKEKNQKQNESQQNLENKKPDLLNQQVNQNRNELK